MRNREFIGDFIYNQHTAPVRIVYDWRTGSKGNEISHAEVYSPYTKPESGHCRRRWTAAIAAAANAFQVEGEF